MPDEGLERLLELVPDATVAVDRDGAIVMVNAQAELLFGYRRSELVGQPLELLVPERLRERHAAMCESYFAAPSIRPMDSGLHLQGRRRDGALFSADISLSPIELDGRTVVVAAIRDVSQPVRERQTLEAELRQLRRSESIGQLAGGIAHDFNNLLGVIINYAQFALAAAQPGSSQYTDIEEVERAAHRAAALTRQLLIFSRREAVRKQVIDVPTLLADMDRLLRRALGEAVSLETDVPEDLRPIEADPGQLEQVLVNLAVNARDAMPAGGTLAITAENVDLDEASLEPESGLAAGAYVRITVADSGHGMTDEVLAHACEPFFTTKPRGAGTGLGLSTVSGIVTEAGGSITLYSEPGLGTTVKINLPAAEDPAADAVADLQPREQAGGTESILLVEDEDAVRRAAERILSGAGYDVIAAGGAREALQVNRPVDLLLTDVVMPDIGGPELVISMRDRYPNLRVLYMSGYARQIVELHELLPPGGEALEKPFTADSLLRAVRRAIDQP